MKTIFRLVLITASIIHVSLQGMSSHVNLLLINDTLLRPYWTTGTCYQFAGYFEGGIHQTAFNCHGAEVNPLAIFNPTQNALAMLAGFGPNCTATQLLNEIDAIDDGTRGHLCFTGHLREKFAGMFQGSWMFYPDYILHAYLPVYSYRLNRVCIADLTRDVTEQDLRVKELLTDTIRQVAFELGDLELADWHRSGIGDLTFFIEWLRDFYQNKQMIKEVRLNLRLGLGLPTGLREDDRKIFAFPFGNDGSFSMPFGFGVDVTYQFPLRLGFDVQLTHIFGNTRCRRIKTDICQTDFLLLATARTYRDYGMIQRFNLYGEIYQLLPGTSFMIGYQFYKQGKSELSISSNNFSNAIANTAQSLQEWTVHQIIAKIDYEGKPRRWRNADVVPKGAVYSRIPFNGERVAANTTLGCVVGIAF